MVIDASGLVDMEKGLINRRIYTDPDIYQQELEQIFGRAWLVIGHESLVPNPNDFFLTYMGEDPVILTRDAKGEVHAFLNMCRHRGNRVARADDGNAKNFMCTYHGWTYSNDGALVSVPGLQEAYYGELDVDKLGLVSVAQIESYAGLVFATWDPQAPSLEDYLGDFRWYLDTMFNQRDAGLQFIGPDKWIIPTNWKFPTDNFAGDTYHFPLTHISALMAQATSGMKGGLAERTAATKTFDVTSFYKVGQPGGHSVLTGNGLGGMVTWNDSEEEYWKSFDNFAPNPRLREYQKKIMPEVVRRLGTLRAFGLSMVIGNIFPNVAVHTPSNLVRIWMPRGPFHTEVWAFTYYEKDMPEDVQEIIRRRSGVTFNPSGIFEQDDMDNWRQCTDSGMSLAGRHRPQILSLGLGHDTTRSPMVGEVAGHTVNESPQRRLYARWQEFMNAKSWADIQVDPHTAQYEGTATFRG